VTLDQTVYHVECVVRGSSKALVIADMPFGSYQVSDEEAVKNAIRFVKEAGAEAVKLEGGGTSVRRADAIVAAGVPVVGHIGLTPQSVTQLGGYRVQGKTATDASRLLEDAQAIEQAGASLIVLEMIPDRVAARISQVLRIPTIGIGAGSGCDGQVLVLHDLLGMYDRFTPRFAKKYADLSTQMEVALLQYRDDVRSREFPAPENTFTMDDAEYDAWMGTT
jgi:3-methyl-2-oxobutanoate hydroxymethyltransferase